MTNSVFVEGEAPETDDELPMKSHRTKSTKVVVVEGEASETDDEIEDVTAPSTSSAVATTSVEPQDIKIPQRARVHVDEKLVQHWRTLGTDTLMLSLRRLQPTMKTVNEMESCVDNTLATVQAASATIRRTSALVYRLEDSVNAIIEASKLFPEKFENTVEVMKLI